MEPIKAATPDTRRKPAYYNAAFLVKPDGTVGAIYRKMHLVPFGEYVPLQSVLFFAGPIIGAVAEFSSFTPGLVPVLLPVGRTSASTAICYEVIYPEPDPPIRSATGSELLTTITNDAVVRHVIGRVSALGSGVDARHRGRAAILPAPPTPASAASSIPTGVSSPGRPLRTAVVVRDVRFLTDRTIYSRIGDRGAGCRWR